MIGHRPQLCSAVSESDQHLPTSPLFESNQQLMDAFGVDLYLSGHQHLGELVHPVNLSGGVVTWPDGSGVYVAPKSAVRVVQGTGGVFMGYGGWLLPTPAWSAARSNEFGYGRLSVFDRHTLRYDFLLTEHDGKVGFGFTIAKP